MPLKVIIIFIPIWKDYSLLGLYYGVVNSVSGVVNGVIGTVVEPIKGAQSGGVMGFFRGVGVGAIGYDHRFLDFFFCVV